MTDKNARLPREPDQGFVGRLVPDPASPPELTLLVGYPGDSSEKGSIRLYASPDLSRWWEIPEEEILHRQTVPNDPLGAEIVWVRRDKQPVLDSRRSDSDMTTFTLGFPTCGHTLVQTVSGFNCPTGPVQHQPFTIMGLNCPTGLPQHQPLTIGGICGPGPQQAPHSQICGTTPVGAAAPAALHPTWFGACTIPPVSVGCPPPPTAFQICTIPPQTTGCVYPVAQGQNPPPPPPPTTQAGFAHGYAWPTFDINCGTSPVAQGAQVAQQTYAVHTYGPTMTIPPVTFCCPR